MTVQVARFSVGWRLYVPHRSRFPQVASFGGRCTSLICKNLYYLYCRSRSKFSAAPKWGGDPSCPDYSARGGPTTESHNRTKRYEMDVYDTAAAEPAEVWIAAERVDVILVELMADDSGVTRELALTVDAALELADALAAAVAG